MNMGLLECSRETDFQQIFISNATDELQKARWEMIHPNHLVQNLQKAETPCEHAACSFL